MSEEDTTQHQFNPFFSEEEAGENLEFKSLAEKALLEKYLKECKEKGVIPQTSVLFENDQ